MNWLTKYWKRRHEVAKKIGWYEDLEYYVYRSPSKINMLWEQIDARSVAKISGELKVKLGIVEVGGKVEERQPNIHDKLRVVLRSLEINEQVGDIGSGKPFVRGLMPMTWQEAEFRPGRSDASMVLFSGCAGASVPSASEAGATLVGLVGSSAYVTGMNDLKVATLDYSKPQFWKEVIETLNGPAEEEFKNNAYDLRRMVNYQAVRRADGPPKPLLQFVAKVFLSDGGFLIGSPLYVSQSQQDPLLQGS